MKILVTGSGGFIGQNILPHLVSSGYNIFCTIHKNTSNNLSGQTISLDMLDTASIKKNITMLKPDIVIHLAALTDVDFCEKNRLVAKQVNTSATRAIAESVSQYGGCLLFFSTDLVFDGHKGFYSESNRANPISYYGETKYEAEKRLLGNYAIFRLALSFGAGNCFLDKMIHNLKEGREVNLYTNQWRSPIYTKNVARIVLAAIENREKVFRGEIFHIGGGERISRWAFGLKVCEAFGFSEKLLIPTKEADKINHKKRPADCSMTITKIKKWFSDISLLSLDESLIEINSLTKLR